ncbi:MAG: ribonuclease P protein component [Pseudomonadota bacterium]
MSPEPVSPAKPPATIKARRDFLAARRAPSKGTPGFLLVRKDRRDLEPARVGYTLTKKLGNAVRRNRIRRRLKAVVRDAFPGVASQGCDYIVIARPAAGTRPYALLLDDMKRALLTLAKSRT